LSILTLLVPVSAAPEKTYGKMPSQPPEQWIELGRRVHGGFGSFIVLGIRVGQDAAERLEAGPRELDVTYMDGAAAPCACIADGLMISAYATPGQNSLRITAEKSPAGTMGVAIIKHKKTGRTLRYAVPATARKILDEANTKNERGRYDAIMAEPVANLFTVQEVAAETTPKTEEKHD
jgi:formylmethanofuran dehydrogenase subunit E